MKNSAPDPLVSFIIPTWGDDAAVLRLVNKISLDPKQGEWIVAAVDPSANLVRLDSEKAIRLVRCETPSRGRQMNLGAEEAAGRLFCFHHADSELELAHLDTLIQVLRRTEVVGGAFHRHFDDRHPWMKKLEKITGLINARIGPLFGDQSIFVRAEVYQALGGFADIPLMEDLEFSRRLRRAGRVVLLDPPMHSSVRRFRRLGRWRATVFNVCLILLFYLGVRPRLLHRWYYARKFSS